MKRCRTCEGARHYLLSEGKARDQGFSSYVWVKALDETT